MQDHGSGAALHKLIQASIAYSVYMLVDDAGRISKNSPKVREAARLLLLR